MKPREQNQKYKIKEKINALHSTTPGKIFYCVRDAETHSTQTQTS